MAQEASHASGHTHVHTHPHTHAHTHPHPLSHAASHTLDMRGPRGGLTRERATEYVERVLRREVTHFRKVVLSTWAFSVEAAEVVADAIKLLPDLEVAVLSDIIAGRPEAEGLAVYRTLGVALKDKQLKEIDLSDNAVGPKGVEACREFLSSQHHLQRLWFCNCGISAEAARSIADVLLFRMPTELRLLHFDNNMSGNGGAIAIADIVSASPELRDFRFSSSRGGSDGGVALARAFRNTPLIERINISDNTFGVRGADALGAAFRRCLHLVELNIADIALGDEGMELIASGLVRGAVHTLQVLNVSANDITEDGAQAIARCLRRMPHLRVLDASENELGSLGARYIARGLQRRAEFRVREAQVGAGAHAVAEAAAAAPPAQDPLEELHLRECEIGSGGALALARAVLKHTPHVSALHLTDNEITAAGVKQLQELFQDASRETVIKTLLDADLDDDDDEGEDDESDEELEADEAESDLDPDASESEEEPDSADEMVAKLTKKADDADMAALAAGVMEVKL